MRHVLVDHARARKAAKRGGGAAALELEEWMGISERGLDGLIEIDEALQRLEAMEGGRVRSWSSATSAASPGGDG
jgi:hypothetical protein